jgi:hypothetical protein
MRRRHVYGFDNDSGQTHARAGSGFRPHRRTHLREPADRKTHLRIGTREFKLNEARNEATARVLLVERDLLIRAALVALVSNWKGFHVVAVRTKKEALALRDWSPDVVLVSLAIADTATVTDLSLAYGPDRLIVLLGHRAEGCRFQIGRLSHRVLMKSTRPNTLKKAIGGISPSALLESTPSINRRKSDTRR